MVKKTTTTDLETVRSMKKSNKKDEETLSLYNALKSGSKDAADELQSIIEYNESFFTGFNEEKFNQYKKLKSLCQSVSQMDTMHDFTVSVFDDPSNCNHSGSVCVDVPTVWVLNSDKYKTILKIANLADNVFVSAASRKNIRITFIVEKVFYDESADKEE